MTFQKCQMIANHADMIPNQKQWWPILCMCIYQTVRTTVLRCKYVFSVEQIELGTYTNETLLHRIYIHAGGQNLWMWCRRISIHCERKHILLTFLRANFQTKHFLLDERVRSDRFIGVCPAFCMAISGISGSKTVFLEGKRNIGLFRQYGQAITAIRKVSKV